MNKITEIKTEAIADAIELLTGLRPVEKITEDRYCLSLGVVEPLEVGYDKRRKVLKEDTMHWSAHLRMLQEVAVMARESAEFIKWLDRQP